MIHFQKNKIIKGKSLISFFFIIFIILSGVNILKRNTERNEISLKRKKMVSDIIKSAKENNANKIFINFSPTMNQTFGEYFAIDYSIKLAAKNNKLHAYFNEVEYTLNSNEDFLYTINNDFSFTINSFYNYYYTTNSQFIDSEMDFHINNIIKNFEFLNAEFTLDFPILQYLLESKSIHVFNFFKSEICKNDLSDTKLLIYNYFLFCFGDNLNENFWIDEVLNKKSMPAKNLFCLILFDLITDNQNCPPDFSKNLLNSLQTISSSTGDFESDLFLYTFLFYTSQIDAATFKDVIEKNNIILTSHDARLLFIILLKTDLIKKTDFSSLFLKKAFYKNTNFLKQLILKNHLCLLKKIYSKYSTFYSFDRY